MFGLGLDVFGVAFGIEDYIGVITGKGSGGPVHVFDWIGACPLLCRKAPSHSVPPDSPAPNLSDRSNFVGAYSPSSVYAQRGCSMCILRL